MGGGVRCVGCREGHGGDRCQFCAEGYVGDPTGEMTGDTLCVCVCVCVCVREMCCHCSIPTGSPVPCRLCECNGNVDPANSDPCDITTGACIGCLGNTAGDRCEQCALGYTGDAITAKNCTGQLKYWLYAITHTLPHPFTLSPSPLPQPAPPAMSRLPWSSTRPSLVSPPSSLSSTPPWLSLDGSQRTSCRR